MLCYYTTILVNWFVTELSHIIFSTTIHFFEFKLNQKLIDGLINGEKTL